MKLFILIIIFFGMSVLSTRSALIEYILSLLKNSNKKVSFILTSCDGLQSVAEYHENIRKLDHTRITITKIKNNSSSLF